MEETREVNSTIAAISSIKTELEAVHLILKEMDRRYEQRFSMQEKAVTMALAAQEKAVAAALAAAEKAVLVAEANSEKWRGNANEWRGAMDDRETKMVMKEHLNPMLASLQKEVTELKTAQLQASGKGAGLSAAWGYVVTIIGIIISVLSAFGVVLMMKGK